MRTIEDENFKTIKERAKEFSNDESCIESYIAGAVSQREIDFELLKNFLLVHSWRFSHLIDGQLRYDFEELTSCFKKAIDELENEKR